MSLNHEPKHELNLKSRGGRIAYAIEAFFACTATDFIDPVLATLQTYSRKFSLPEWVDKPLRGFRKVTSFLDHSHSEDEGHEHAPSAKDALPENATKWTKLKHIAKHGELGNWVKAEAMGDIGGSVAFIGITELAPGLVTKAADTLRKIPGIKQLVDKMARGSLKQQQLDQLPQDSEAYEAELENARDYHSRSLLYSSMITVLSTAGNVLSQKHILKSDHSYGQLFQDKLGGIIGTWLVLFGVRQAAPNAVQKWENKVSSVFSDKIVEKIANKEADKNNAKSTTIASETVDLDKQIRRLEHSPSPEQNHMLPESREQRAERLEKLEALKAKRHEASPSYTNRALAESTATLSL